MEDNLFDRIRESEQLYGQVEMPSQALQDYKQYVSGKVDPSNGISKRILLGLITALILTNGFWIVKTIYKNPIETTSSVLSTIEESKDTIYITKKDYLTDSENTSADSSDELKSIQNTLTNQSIKFNQDRVHFLTVIEDLRSKIRRTKSLVSNKTISLDDTLSSDTAESETKSQSLSLYENRSLLNKIATIENLEISSPVYKNNKILIPQEPIVIRLDKQMSIGEFLRPKSFSLLTTTGIVQQTPNKYSALSGHQLGFGFTSLMTNHWRYNLSFEYSRLNEELKDEDVIPNIEAPMPPEGSVLEEVYLSQSGLQGSFGVDYLFSPIKFIRPYAGIYYQYRSSHFNDILFKFERDGSEELELSSPNTTRINQTVLGLRAGLDINLWKSIDAFASINYNHNLSELENNYLSLNYGLYYHF